MRDDGKDDLTKGLAEMGVAPQVNVGFMAKIGNDPVDFDRQQREGSERDGPTGEPAASAQSEPDAEPHDR